VLENFAFQTFESRVGERFLAYFDAGTPAELELVSVERLAPTGVGRADPFSLLFTAGPNDQHPQRIYRLEHDELGSFELFLVPLQPDERGPLYEATFA
jgi:hypothetical protein